MNPEKGFGMARNILWIKFYQYITQTRSILIINVKYNLTTSCPTVTTSFYPQVIKSNVLYVLVELSSYNVIQAQITIHPT